MNSPYTGPVEPGIFPLCEALNACAEIKTQYSCEGHPLAGMPPYVVFSTDLHHARKLQLEMDTGHLRERLKYCWQITGYFENTTNWLYCISANDIRLTRPPHFGIIPRWRRSEMDVELLTMTNIVEVALSRT